MSRGTQGGGGEGPGWREGGGEGEGVGGREGGVEEAADPEEGVGWGGRGVGGAWFGGFEGGEVRGDEVEGAGVGGGGWGEVRGHDEGWVYRGSYLVEMCFMGKLADCEVLQLGEAGAPRLESPCAYSIQHRYYTK